MSDWSVKIRRVYNGFVVETKSEVDGGPVEAVIQENEDIDPDKVQALLAEDLCYFVLNEFCLTGTKHDRFRINVSIEEQE